MFSHPGSRPVSSEGSAEAAPQAVREHQPGKSIGEDLSVAGQAKAASVLPPLEGGGSVFIPSNNFKPCIKKIEKVCWGGEGI